MGSSDKNAMKKISYLMAGRAVIKIGGNEIDDFSFLEQFITLVKGMPVLPLIVHGGGKEITDLLSQLGIKSEKIQGLRVTDATGLRVTEMILSGLVNKRLVKMLVMADLEAIGISGVDARLFQAQKLCIEGGDLGCVGTIIGVNTHMVEQLLIEGFLPVISPISIGIDGQVYNVNADSAAQALAEALQVERLVFITDVPGVKIGGKFQEMLNTKDVEKNIQSGEIYGGMIPKVRAALQAVQKGVGSVVITNAQNFIAGKGTIIQNK
ncbi:MAG: acetylglutamate kinase [Promethearchaeota archaeon CR_4]|nr:MAG: acetylglutamate kinase [Candidatus Lokiarchaeota archaeon CR_4]